MKKVIIMIALVTLSVTNSKAQESTLTDNREKLFFSRDKSLQAIFRT